MHEAGRIKNLEKSEEIRETAPIRSLFTIFLMS